MRCFLLDPTALLSNRAALDNPESPLQAPLASLLKAAEQKLSAGPFSVTSKEMPGPSGDLHDYCHSKAFAMSFGRDFNRFLERIATRLRCFQVVWAAIGGLMSPSPMACPYIRKDGHPNPDRGKVGDNGRFASMLHGCQHLFVDIS